MRIVSILVLGTTLRGKTRVAMQGAPKWKAQLHTTGTVYDFPQKYI